MRVKVYREPFTYTERMPLVSDQYKTFWALMAGFWSGAANIGFGYQGKQNVPEGLVPIGVIAGIIIFFVARKLLPELSLRSGKTWRGIRLRLQLIFSEQEKAMIAQGLGARAFWERHNYPPHSEAVAAAMQGYDTYKVADLLKFTKPLIISEYANDYDAEEAERQLHAKLADLAGAFKSFVGSSHTSGPWSSTPRASKPTEYEI
jgi:hypothetical protein